jgi:hypothetical protein
MVHEAGLRDSAWSRRCEGIGGGVCGVAAGRGPVDPVSLLKVRALWMVALRLVLLLLGVRLMGCKTNLESKTQSCCGCGVAGAY